jgi:hypothetical protein
MRPLGKAGAVAGSKVNAKLPTMLLLGGVRPSSIPMKFEAVKLIDNVIGWADAAVTKKKITIGSNTDFFITSLFVITPIFKQCPCQLREFNQFNVL